MVKIAWMFSPYDNKDPSATVEVTDCSGTIKGYVYPKAGPGHTVPVRACTENGLVVIGFAANNSNAAARMLTYQGDCGCGGSNEANGNGATKVVQVESKQFADIFGDKL